MYKVGDKVETPHGTGWVKSYSEVYDMYIVDLKGVFKNQQYKPHHLKLYISAHDKLLDIGWVITVDGVVKTYQDKGNWLNVIWVDKAHKTVSTNFHHGLVLSCILTQLLEEME